MVARVASADNASGGNLNAIYVQNVPGVTPATLTALNNGSLNLNPNFAAVFPGDSLRNDSGDGLLRVRDIVLLRGQTNQEDRLSEHVQRLAEYCSGRAKRDADQHD